MVGDIVGWSSPLNHDFTFIAKTMCNFSFEFQQALARRIEKGQETAFFRSKIAKPGKGV